MTSRKEQERNNHYWKEAIDHLGAAIKAYKNGQYLLFLKYYFKAELYHRETSVVCAAYDNIFDSLCKEYDIPKIEIIRAANGGGLEITKKKA